MASSSYAVGNGGSKDLDDVASKDWRKLFAASLDRASEFYPPEISDGKIMVAPPDEIFEEGEQLWKSAVVAQFVVRLRDGIIASVWVEVPWHPHKCTNCSVFGHSSKNYQMKPTPAMKMWVPKQSTVNKDEESITVDLGNEKQEMNVTSSDDKGNEKQGMKVEVSIDKGNELKNCSINVEEEKSNLNASKGKAKSANRFAILDSVDDKEEL
ncbi:hypothetical protein DITRI_Ditri02bG0141500 [Diplodiscus trichospermus]